MIRSESGASITPPRTRPRSAVEDTAATLDSQFIHEWPDPPAALRLWDSFAAARAYYDPRILAAAEDAVYQFYLPLARHLAHATNSAAESRRVRAERGLAKAVMAWVRPDAGQFEEYARGAIESEMRQPVNHARTGPPAVGWPAAATPSR